MIILTRRPVNLHFMVGDYSVVDQTHVTTHNPHVAICPSSIAPTNNLKSTYDSAHQTAAWFISAYAST